VYGTQFESRWLAKYGITGITLFQKRSDRCVRSIFFGASKGLVLGMTVNEDEYSLSDVML